MLVAVAEALEREPVAGVRVVLASCGAEEILQGGIHGFAARHLAGMDRERTWVLNLDSVGSPELALLEGEGELVMEDFFDRGWRDLIVRVAEREGIPMRRGLRSRRQHRLGRPEPDEDPDGLPGLDQREQEHLELPLAHRHAGEPELPDGRLRRRSRPPGRP